MWQLIIKSWSELVGYLVMKIGRTKVPTILKMPFWEKKSLKFSLLFSTKWHVFFRIVSKLFFYFRYQFINNKISLECVKMYSKQKYFVFEILHRSMWCYSLMKVKYIISHEYERVLAYKKAENFEYKCLERLLGRVRDATGNDVNEVLIQMWKKPHYLMKTKLLLIVIDTQWNITFI